MISSYSVNFFKRFFLSFRHRKNISTTNILYHDEKSLVLFLYIDLEQVGTEYDRYVSGKVVDCNDILRLYKLYEYLIRIHNLQPFVCLVIKVSGLWRVPTSRNLI